MTEAAALAANADAAAQQRAALRADALAGLLAPRKTLPCKWLYDLEGARLFEAITRQPEYYPTRTEIGILREQASAIAAAVDPGGPPAAGVAPWAAVAALAVFGSAIPLTLFLALAQKAKAADASMVGYLQPAFAAACGALLLAEFPEPRVLAGGAVVLFGVWLATRRA